MFLFLRNLLSRSEYQHPRGAMRLRGETLEDRCVPASFRWVNSVWDSTDHWTVTGNWEVDRDGDWVAPAAGDYPGASGRTDDVVLINDSSIVGRETRCVLDVAVTLKKLEFGPDFERDFTLEQTLTIKDGSLELNNQRSGGYLNGGSSQKQIRLIGPGTTCYWWAATLNAIQLIAEAETKVMIPGRISTETLSLTSLWMAGSSIDINPGGTLDWRGRSVQVVHANGLEPGSNTANLIHIHHGGTFNIFAQGECLGYSTDTSALEVRNRGNMTVSIGSSQATIRGTLNNQDGGVVLVETGTLDVAGATTQTGDTSRFTVYQNGIFVPHNPACVLDIKGGSLTGSGTVNGNVVMTAGVLNPSPDPVAPDLTATFTILGLFDQLGGEVITDIGTREKYDRVVVRWKIMLAGSARGVFLGFLENSDFLPGDRIVFISSTNDTIEGTFAPATPPNAGWIGWKFPKEYAFIQFAGIAGRVRGDANGNGIFEPGDPHEEEPLGGVPVALLNEDHEVVATTTTAADGTYLFEEVGFGNWTVKFTRPDDLRPVLPLADGDESLDSDYDYNALTVGVTLDEATPYVWDTADALFRPLVAVDDDYTTPFRTAVVGNVLDNDPPADGDTLTVTFPPESYPAHGTLVPLGGGAFTYTPDRTFYGSDAFVYEVTDSFGHTATAAVTITVVPPPPAVVSGRVFNDGWEYSNFPTTGGDRDGLQTGSEGGYAGVGVQLLDATGAVVATAVTGVGGVYTFTFILTDAAQFRVRFALPTSPDPYLTYRFSPPDQGDDAIDSDADPATGETALFDLDVSQTASRDAGVIWRYFYHLPPSPPPPPPMSPPPP